MCEHSAYRKWLIETQTGFLNRSLQYSIQKELHSPDPDTVKHHRLAGLLNISMLSTVHWHFPGNISVNIYLNFSSFLSLLFEATNVWVGQRNPKSKNKGNVEQAKTLTLNPDSSRGKHCKRWRVSCWFSVTCNQLVFSFSSFLPPDKANKTASFEQ